MIDVDSVSVTLGNNRVLSDVSLSVDEGTFVGLIGPNGAGKTTLLRTVSGVLTPTHGTVRVDGDPVTDLSSREASRRVAVVPQDTTLSFEFDVRQVVEMGRHPHRTRFSVPSSEGSDVVDRAMERVDVAELADRSIDEVSGGERRRVIVARALAQATPVLLLDEPTASLDVTAKVEILALAEELVSEGKTVLAAIHDLDLAARFCDELALLSEGEVVATGPPTDVLDRDRLAGAFGGDPVVGASPVTGRPTVTGLRTRATIDGRVHVFGTGPRAVRVLSTLREHGAELSVGPVPETDVAAVSARALGTEVIDVPTFGTAADRTGDVRTVLDDADVAVAVNEESPVIADAGHRVPVIGLEESDVTAHRTVPFEDLVDAVSDPPDRSTVEPAE